MSVYFIRMAKSNLFKIGYAIKPLRRLETLQVGCPYELELFAVIRGAPRELEAVLHREYSKKHFSGRVV